MTTENLTKTNPPLRLSDKERCLIEQLRLVPYGRFEIIMQEGQPDRIVELRKDIKL